MKNLVGDLYSDVFSVDWTTFIFLYKNYNEEANVYPIRFIVYTFHDAKKGYKMRWKFMYTMHNIVKTVRFDIEEERYLCFFFFSNFRYVRWVVVV